MIISLKDCFLRVMAFAVLAFLLLGSPAYAQATRTWVSGVGDDANPCSRTAPCKTFAGAISKTAAGGEINVLDPGGFGAVTIVKSISIESDGAVAGVLAAGTNGIVVNAGPNDKVVLRGLIIEGVGGSATPGLSGIRFLAGGALHVENCTINGFGDLGINFIPSGASQLFVKNTIIRNTVATAGGMNGGGIMIEPGLAGSADASLDQVRLENNLFALRAKDGAKVAIRDGVISGNANNGVVVNTVASAAEVSFDRTTIANNETGIRSSGAQAIARISETLITGNGTGLLRVNNGQIVSFGNNRISGNTTDGTPSSTIGQQ